MFQSEWQSSHIDENKIHLQTMEDEVTRVQQEMIE